MGVHTRIMQTENFTLVNEIITEKIKYLNLRLKFNNSIYSIHVEDILEKYLFFFFMLLVKIYFLI